MGLLDLLGIGGTKEERETRSVRKLQKKAVEKYGPKENRQGAIEELGEMRTPRAVEALLMRYTVRVEPGITDDEEKQRVLALVQQAGSGIAVPVLKSFILRRDEVSWPLKALSDLLPEAEVVAFLVEALRKAAGEYSRVPEAVQKDERSREPLIQHFLRAHQASNARVREALASLLADTHFDVKGYTPKMEASLPASYKLDSKGRVVRKS